MSLASEEQDLTSARDNLGGALVSLAGARLEVRSRDETWLRLVQRRYGGTGNSGDPTMIVDDVAGGGPVGSGSSWYGVDLANRHAWLSARGCISRLDRLLRELLPEVMPQRALIHAALIENGVGQAWLCCGRSGAGKSTLAQLAGQRALCDELVAVTAEAGEAWAEPLPFPWRRACTRVRLARCFLLRHGATHVGGRLGEAEALRRLSRHVRWPFRSQEQLGAAFAVVSSLAGAVSVSELTFAPLPDVLEMLAEEGAA